MAQSSPSSTEESRLVHLVELTVPEEDAVDEAYERKKLQYAQLAAEAEQRGWRVQVYPVEGLEEIKLAVAIMLTTVSTPAI
ncbi:UNVERIFIED_CONTAM: hypothetical protein FKN15_053234 [Acipenser sinensis]